MRSRMGYLRKLVGKKKASEDHVAELKELESKSKKNRKKEVGATLEVEEEPTTKKRRGGGVKDAFFVGFDNNEKT